MFTKSLPVAVAAASLLSGAVATYDPTSEANVAVYWVCGRRRSEF